MKKHTEPLRTVGYRIPYSLDEQLTNYSNMKNISKNEALIIALNMLLENNNGTQVQADIGQVNMEHVVQEITNYTNRIDTTFKPYHIKSFAAGITSRYKIGLEQVFSVLQTEVKNTIKDPYYQREATKLIETSMMEMGVSCNM